MVFNTIPSDFNVPGSFTEYDLLSGYQGLQSANKNILILAQQLPTLFEAENFVNGELTSGTNWTTNSRDCTLVRNKAEWISSGTLLSTMSQTTTVMGTIRAIKPNTWYKFTYTVSDVLLSPTCTITTAFAGVETSIPLTIGTNSVYVKSGSSPTAFTLQSTLSAGKQFFLDDLSLMEVKNVNNPVFINSLGESRATFGAKSIAHIMVKNVYDVNKYASIMVCPLMDEVASTATTYTFQVSGAPSSGQYIFKIANRTFDLTCASIAEFVLSLKAAIDADEYCPYTCNYTGSSSPYSFTLTASNKGSVNSYCRVYFVKYPTGLEVTAIEKTSGTTDPVLTTALSNCEKVAGSIYSVQFSDGTNLSTIKTHIDGISDAIIQNPAVSVFGYSDLIGTQSDSKTLCGTTLNYWRMFGGNYPYCDNLPYEIGSQISGAFSKQPKPGYPIDFSELKLHVPNPEFRLTINECNSLIKYGVMPVIVENETSKLMIACSTYTNTAGINVQKLRGIETATALDYIRTNVKALEILHYRNRKNNAETREQLKLEIYDLLLKLQGPDYEITQNVEENLNGIIVTEDDTNPGRANVLIPTDIVMGLHIIANQIRLI